MVKNITWICYLKTCSPVTTYAKKRFCTPLCLCCLVSLGSMFQSWRLGLGIADRWGHTRAQEVTHAVNTSAVPLNHYRRWYILIQRKWTTFQSPLLVTWKQGTPWILALRWSIPCLYFGRPAGDHTEAIVFSKRFPSSISRSLSCSPAKILKTVKHNTN